MQAKKRKAEIIMENFTPLSTFFIRDSRRLLTTGEHR